MTKFPLPPPQFGYPLLRLPKLGPTIFPLLVYLEVYLVGAAGVETTFWVTKLEKWVTKMSFSHSNLVTPLELLLVGAAGVEITFYSNSSRASI